MPTALKRLHDRENGFTLIELLIVVLIIGVLAAIAIPVYLGIQQQGYRASVRADVNLSVKRVQVGLTEGASISDVKASPNAYTQKSVRGENVYIATSTTPGAGANDFQLSGVVNTSTSPAGPLNYAYTYDSVTGNFTDSDTGLAFGSANPTLTITTANIANAVTGQAYSQTVAATATNPTGTTTWAATGLPAGFTINATTGVIAAPASAVTTAGTYPIVVTASNGSTTGTRNYTLSIVSTPSISTTSLSNATLNAQYSATVNATGTPAPTFSATGLPPGVTIDSTSGVIAGTPTTNGSYSVTVTATNTGGSASASLALLVGSAPAITTTSLPADNPYASYNTVINATGYPSPNMTFTNAVSGFSLTTGGTLTGTLPGSGSTSIPVTATNPFGSVNTSLAVTPRANLLTNPSFESSGADVDLPIYNGTQTNLWAYSQSGGSDAIARVWGSPSSSTYTDVQGTTISPVTGSKMLGYFPGSKGTTSVIQDVTTTVTAGSTYTIGFWYRDADATHSQNLVFEAYTLAAANNANCNLAYQGLTATNTWRYYTINVTSSCAGPMIRYQITPTAGNAFDGKFNTVYDGMSLTKTN